MVVIDVPRRRLLGADWAPAFGAVYHQAVLVDREAEVLTKAGYALLASVRAETAIGMPADLGVAERAPVSVQLTISILMLLAYEIGGLALLAPRVLPAGPAVVVRVRLIWLHEQASDTPP